MKKRFWVRTAAAFLAAVLLYPVEARALSAQKAILVDGQTGRVLYEKRADERSLVASTTKIMTALLVCQQCNVLEQMQIPKEATGIEGSSMYLKAGEVLTVQELLYGLMLSSGNDAAVALAIYCDGSVDAFVERMNRKAESLGLTGTHFANPHGLDAPEHYSTARDLAVLAAYAMENPIFVQTVSTKAVHAGGRYLTNHNKLLWQVPGADGVKTGFTKAAGRILVSSAVQQGRRLVCVTIDDGNDWADHAALYRQGFSVFSPRKILSAGQILGEYAVFGGEQSQVRLYAGEDFSYALAEGEQVQICFGGRAFVYAPVAANAPAGFAYILVDGKAVGKVPVYYESTVLRQRTEKKSLRQRWFGGTQ